VFRALFQRTPLIPFERNPGSPDRWIDAYGVSLAELEAQWRSKIVSRPPSLDQTTDGQRQ
jgi:hypothetical protein